MANLSPDERVIIAKHPLGNSLDQLRDALRKAEDDYRPGPIPYNGTYTGQDRRQQETISNLLLTLMGHKVAFNLRSKTENDNVATKLSKLFGLIQRGRYNYEHYRTLSRLVVKQVPDVDIWNAVFDLITTVSRTTPPTSLPISFDGTPITYSSSS